MKSYANYKPREFQRFYNWSRIAMLLMAGLPVKFQCENGVSYGYVEITPAVEATLKAYRQNCQVGVLEYESARDRVKVELLKARKGWELGNAWKA